MRCFYVMIYANIWQSLLFREGEFGSQVLQFAGRANIKIEVSSASGLAPLWPDLLFGISVQGSARPSRQYMFNKNALATRQGG